MARESSSYRYVQGGMRMKRTCGVALQEYKERSSGFEKGTLTTETMLNPYWRSKKPNQSQRLSKEKTKIRLALYRVYCEYHGPEVSLITSSTARSYRTEIGETGPVGDVRKRRTQGVRLLPAYRRSPRECRERRESLIAEPGGLQCAFSCQLCQSNVQRFTPSK